MKSVMVDNKKEGDCNYPYLGINSGGDRVILFTEEGKGTVLYSKDNAYYPSGWHSEGWIEENFLPYEGEIHLSNG